MDLISLRIILASLEQKKSEPETSRFRLREDLNPKMVGKQKDIFPPYLAEQPTPHPELSAFRWMLEELRVSLFTPELKTAYPVSVHRLEKIWQPLQQST